MTKIPKYIKKILRGTSIALTAVCLLCTILIVYMAIVKAAGEPLPTVFGWSNAVVMSGSMEPELPVGALVIIHKQNSYSLGDVVTYEKENGTLVTHRLLSLKDGVAVTKGDANNTEDAPISAEQIQGKVKAVYPHAGNLLLWMRSPAGVTLILLLGGILIFLPNYLKRKVDVTHA